MIDYPQLPHGTPDEKIEQLWDYLYKQAERINVDEEARRQEQQAVGAAAGQGDASSIPSAEKRRY